MKPILLMLWALCLCLSATLWAAPHSLPQSSRALDEQLAATLQSLSSGNMSEARVLARQAAERFPKSALAQLLAAELSATAAHGRVLAGGSDNKRLQALLLEARARLHDRPAPSIGASTASLPDEVVQLGRHVSDLLVVDLADSSLHHLAVNAGIPTLLQQHYIGSGKAGFDKRAEGDNKTPLGIYQIDGYRSDASLPDLYGSGALTLDYPNALDHYLGRTGSGIWLHGVPHGQRSRSPRSSEGCVVMSNDHFTSLYERLSGEPMALPRSASAPQARIGKPTVLLTHDIHWRDASSREQEQLEFQTLFERYQRAWHERNVGALLTLYASPALARERLRQVVTQKQPGALLLDSVDKSDISIFYNPHLSAGKAYLPVASQAAAEQAAEQATQQATQQAATQVVTRAAPPLVMGKVAAVPQSAGADGTAKGSYLVMQMHMGESGEYQLSLYWEQNRAGQWHLLTEQWNLIDS